MYKTFVLIFVMHIVAGFFLQSKKISKLKREKTRYLFLHVSIYTAFFIIFSPILLGLTFLQGLIYSLINGVLHLAVDYVTGKFKVKYFEVDNFKYKLTEGIDYTLHLAMLISTYVCLHQNLLFNFNM